MKKIFKKFAVPTLILLFVFGGAGFAFTPSVSAQVPGKVAEAATTGKTVDGANSPGFWATIFQNLIATIGTILLQITALFTGLAGTILNAVVYFTVVDVANNYGNMEPIKVTWGVIRDLANMSFIFVLLYAAIMTILGKGGDNKKVIINVVVAAVLLNFSLFFTRVVIDVANVLALTFYDAIAPGALNATGTLQHEGFTVTQAGLSNAFTKHLGIQSLYNIGATGKVTWDTILTLGVMGSIIQLIAAFVFLAVAIMFVIRYVVLILVMILSPVYFVSRILPEAKELSKLGNQWLEALTGQAFFAPIYFLLTWVALKVMDGVFKVFQPAGGATLGDNLAKPALGGLAVINTPSTGTILLILNFGIVIALIIASLTIAKSWADKAGGGMSKLTSWATGKAGAATFGMAGKFGRQTVGRAGQALSDNQWLRERAPESRLARLALAAGQKTGTASFDARGAKIASQLDAGKAGGEKGFQGEREKTVKRRMEELSKLNDTVTGADLEREMERRGYGKADNDRLNRTPYEVEAMRRRIQADMIRGAEANTGRRKDRYLHHLSQQRWYSGNPLYNGVGTDAEAARRLRGKKKKKKSKDDEDEYENENEKTQEEKIAEAVAKALGQNRRGPTGGGGGPSGPGPGTPPPGRGPNRPPQGGPGGRGPTPPPASPQPNPTNPRPVGSGSTPAAAANNLVHPSSTQST